MAQIPSKETFFKETFLLKSLPVILIFFIYMVYLVFFTIFSSSVLCIFAARWVKAWLGLTVISFSAIFRDVCTSAFWHFLLIDESFISNDAVNLNQYPILYWEFLTTSIFITNAGPICRSSKAFSISHWNLSAQNNAINLSAIVINLILFVYQKPRIFYLNRSSTKFARLL